jgi:hypothetical protein
MVKTGEWDRAVEVCRTVLDASDAPATARMVAAAELGIVYVLRGETRRTRRLLSDSFAFGRRNELFGLEVDAAYGLARADALGGRVDDALQRASQLIGRIADREERHYCVPALRWITTLFARRGLKDDVARSTELLSRTAGALGTAEALAGLGHALGELALLDGDATGAARQFTHAVDVLGHLMVPYERAETELRAAVALAAAEERGLAIQRLTAAYRAARRLGARPLATAAAEELAGLGEMVERRLGRRAAGSLSAPDCDEARLSLAHRGDPQSRGTRPARDPSLAGGIARPGSASGAAAAGNDHACAEGDSRRARSSR